MKTNLQNKGLISADRGAEATLMLTIPRSLFKSYAKDLSIPIFELVFSPVTRTVSGTSRALHYYDLGHTRKHAYTYS